MFAKLVKYIDHDQFIVCAATRQEPRQMGDYEGRAVFLIDRDVASSGEAMIDYSKSIPGAVLICENSDGVGTFGEVRQYWLSNSRISLFLPCKLFLSPGFDERVGYIPDYWLDSAEPVSEIAKWFNNPDSYQFELSQAPVLFLHDLDFNEFDNGLPRPTRASYRKKEHPPRLRRVFASIW